MEIYTVKGFGVADKVEINVSLELPCFFYDPADVGHLISGSSAFSKTSLKGIYGSRIAEAWLGELWALLY